MKLNCIFLFSSFVVHNKIFRVSLIFPLFQGVCCCYGLGCTLILIKSPIGWPLHLTPRFTISMLSACKTISERAFNFGSRRIKHGYRHQKGNAKMQKYLKSYLDFKILTAISVLKAWQTKTSWQIIVPFSLLLSPHWKGRRTTQLVETLFRTLHAQGPNARIWVKGTSR